MTSLPLHGAVTKPFALVSMPTLSGRFPSFQLALLKPTLERAGIPCQTFSLFMYFGTHVGWRLNEALSEVSSALVGEWLWAREAFGDFADADDYLHRFRRSVDDLCARAGITPRDLVRVRDEKVPAFLDFCVEHIDWTRFGAVGLSVVFQQTLATLAFARRLKAKHPELPIILGGGFFEDDIAAEIMKSCREVDAIHCGDADLTLPEIVRRLSAKESLAGQRGLLWRSASGAVVFEGRAPNLTDLSSTPVPDFDEYFYARKEGGYGRHEGHDEVMLPIETARGCWWGMKHHCTFCGLNRAGIEFRAKDAAAVLEMIEQLSLRYGQLCFDAIDNILSPAYVDELFGKLAGAKTDLRIHYEVRPHLRREQLRRMRDGGLCSVQPGIESLSTHVLKLMNKRTTGMRNLELIKWCTYYGINNLYNILVRFHGETRADYDEQLRVIERVPHLQPPKYVVKARADRGSPMFSRPDEHGVVGLKPAACYPYLYPRDRFDLARVSYYFEHEMPGALGDRDYAPLFDAAARWQRAWRGKPRPSLVYRKSWDTLTVDDRRDPARPVRLTFTARHARLYEALLDAKRVEALRAELPGEDPAWIDDALRELDERRLVVFLDERWLALALPANRLH